MTRLDWITTSQSGLKNTVNALNKLVATVAATVSSNCMVATVTQISVVYSSKTDDSVLPLALRLVHICIVRPKILGLYM